MIFTMTEEQILKKVYQELSALELFSVAEWTHSLPELLVIN